MAELKKSSDKTKRSTGPSTTAKPKDGVVEGAAVEKPTLAQSARPVNKTAKPKNQPSTVQDRRRSITPAPQSLAVVIAGTAVVVALIALAVSVVAYQQTAEKTESRRPMAGAAMNGVNQADLGELVQRLDSLATLIAQNADNFASLEQEFASATATRLADAPVMTNLDDLKARLVALEVASVDQMAASALRVEPAVQGGFDTNQLGLLVAAGLLAENLAGRDIEIWAGVLDDLQWPGVDVADRNIIRGAARTPVESRADLLSLGRLQLAPMVQGLNKTDDGSGLLEWVRARLTDLIQLRRTGSASDQPEAMLASFESALDNADFDAAFAAAAMWSSAGLDGLESWLTAAKRRHDLDQAVNRLVALFVQHAAGQS